MLKGCELECRNDVSLYYVLFQKKYWYDDWYQNIWINVELVLRNQHYFDRVRAFENHFDALQEVAHLESVGDYLIHWQSVWGDHGNSFGPAIRSQMTTNNGELLRIA